MALGATNGLVRQRIPFTAEFASAAAEAPAGVFTKEHEPQ